jgi:hypothetical protein
VQAARALPGEPRLLDLAAWSVTPQQCLRAAQRGWLSPCSYACILPRGVRRHPLTATSPACSSLRWRKCGRCIIWALVLKCCGRSTLAQHSGRAMLLIPHPPPSLEPLGPLSLILGIAAGTAGSERGSGVRGVQWCARQPASRALGKVGIQHEGRH